MMGKPLQQAKNEIGTFVERTTAMIEEAPLLVSLNKSLAILKLFLLYINRLSLFFPFSFALNLSQCITNRFSPRERSLWTKNWESSCWSCFNHCSLELSTCNCVKYFNSSNSCRKLSVNQTWYQKKLFFSHFLFPPSPSFHFFWIVYLQAPRTLLVADILEKIFIEAGAPQGLVQAFHATHETVDHAISLVIVLPFATTFFFKFPFFSFLFSFFSLFFFMSD